jgi:hypothetical protein
MRLRAPSAHDFLHTAMLLAASMLVPAAQRAEWRREWRGELWHVRQACGAASSDSRQAQRDVTAFCLGAFPDALCLRRARRSHAAFAAPIKSTPRDCLLALAVLLAVCYALALLLPGVRAERGLGAQRISNRLVHIQLAAEDNDLHPTITPRQFRSWEAQRPMFFDGFAFYRVSRELMQTTLLPSGPPRGARDWAVARADSNIFTLLGLPVEFADSEEASGAMPAVILSERTWRHDFGADPHVAGTVVQLGGQTVRVAGVAADGALALPGRVDAWELEPRGDPRSTAPGFVVARLIEPGNPMMGAQSVRISANGPASNDEDFVGISIDDGQPEAGTVFAFALFLALLALPAITAVSLGEGSGPSHRTSWPRRLYRWSFFGAKVALLLPMIYFASMNLGYGFTSLSREQDIYIQLVSTFCMCLFSLRWALKDQRQRCPVCMHLVTHPAQVGQASRTFLDWNGTEMMCMGGHTLLHVPSLPTSLHISQADCLFE